MQKLYLPGFSGHTGHLEPCHGCSQCHKYYPTSSQWPQPNFTSKLANQLQDDGQLIPFVIVPFADGTNPVVHVHQIQHLYALYMCLFWGRNGMRLGFMLSRRTVVSVTLLSTGIFRVPLTKWNQTYAVRSSGPHKTPMPRIPILSFQLIAHKNWKCLPCLLCILTLIYGTESCSSQD